MAIYIKKYVRQEKYIFYADWWWCSKYCTQNWSSVSYKREDQRVYTIFGIFKSYAVEIRTSKQEYINMEWLTVENGNSLIKSKKEVLDKTECENKEIHIPSVSKDNVRILVKCNNSHLEWVNQFLKLAILDKYYFQKQMGWKQIYEYVVCN